ncbi:glycosyltransferase [Naasia lichenicola]|uniref:Glycosyl transferase family 28 n=1 Tax=Naasia lichenicola TaxID=2565933 RepID=A0A4S4FNC4_9MICO|nr:glycosyltransferase [Naasia lichenicola]THG30773.1 glycosyl transferase family 28 [Naasia lichenicola]THG32010.1 glycosyl transferase family 28 [Naasia lichenicola]
MLAQAPRYLLVSSGGGHLKQLFEYARRLEIDPADQDWVTFDTGLSRTLLSGRRRVFARYAAPRDLPNIFRNFALAFRVLRSSRYAVAISTGASLAVCFLPLARVMGVRTIYIESAARATGPSLTGKIVAAIPGIETFNQYPAWATDKWRYIGSIFDRFARAADAKTEIKKVVVSVGTTESYGFRTLFERLEPLLADVDVTWQTGVTDLTGLDIDGRPNIQSAELSRLVAEADLVISHAGTGAALTALENGKIPLLVPRRKSRGEHVDDHQAQIADDLVMRNLAISAEADDINLIHMNAAAEGRVSAVLPPTISLQLHDTRSLTSND